MSSSSMATHVTATSPGTVTPGTVDVTVTTLVGTSVTSPADEFTYDVVTPVGHVAVAELRTDRRWDVGDDHWCQLHHRRDRGIRRHGRDQRRARRLEPHHCNFPGKR